jgi:hypothetical protein
MTSTDEDEVYRRLALLDARLRAIHKWRGVAAAHAPEIAAIKAALADLGGSAGTDLKHRTDRVTFVIGDEFQRLDWSRP